MEEWQFVRDALYEPKDDGMQEFALEIVQVWVEKGRVPTSVEATANLVRVVRLDRTSAVDDTTKRLAYAAAVTRFVNEIVDSRQAGAAVVPITRLAEQVGLPRFLVDLRHEATHDALPSLAVFRAAVEEGMEWLWVNYWLPQSNHDDLLKDQIEFALERTAAAIRAAKEGQVLSKLAVRNFTEVEYLHSSRQVVDILVDLLFTNYINDQLLVTAIAEMFMNEGGCNLFAMSTCDWLLFNYNPSQAPGHIQMIENLLMEISLHVPDLGEKIFLLILRYMVTAPSEYNQKLADSFYAKGLVRNGKIIELYQLLKQRNVSPSQGIKTIEDVKRLLSSKQQSISNDALIGWRIAEKWKPCPMGMTPDYNPSVDFMSLWQ